MVAIELQGGIWKRTPSGHNTGAGLSRDYEKTNLAQAQGWVCFQLSFEMINDDWLDLIKLTIDKHDQER